MFVALLRDRDLTPWFDTPRGLLTTGGPTSTSQPSATSGNSTCLSIQWRGGERLCAIFPSPYPFDAAQGKYGEGWRIARGRGTNNRWGMSCEEKADYLTGFFLFLFLCCAKKKKIIVLRFLQAKGR